MKLPDTGPRTPTASTNQDARLLINLERGDGGAGPLCGSCYRGMVTQLQVDETTPRFLP